jgi:hypothetical protein
MQVVIDGLFLVEPQYSKKNIAFCLFHTIAASCTHSHRLLLQSKSLGPNMKLATMSNFRIP